MAGSLNEQMDLFAYGGLRDQGGTVDPVSGNPVPVGATQEEVRDDVPAQLSHGEFVFPADVTRYYGLDTLMEMRSKAKQGLQKMENMGQMGGKPMNTGGVVQAPQAGIPQVGVPQVQTPQVQTPQVKMPTVKTPTPPSATPAGVTTTTPSGITQSPTGQLTTQKSQFASGATKSPVTGRTNTATTRSNVVDYSKPNPIQQGVPSFEQLIGTGFGQQQRYQVIEYTNPESGESLYIPHVAGKPLYPVPTGFINKGEIAQKKEEAATPTQVRVPTAQPTQMDEGPGEVDPFTQEQEAKAQANLEALASMTASNFSPNALSTVDFGTSLGYRGLGQGVDLAQAGIGFLGSAAGGFFGGLAARGLYSALTSNMDIDLDAEIDRGLFARDPQQEFVVDFKAANPQLAVMNVPFSGYRGFLAGDVTPNNNLMTTFGYSIDPVTREWSSTTEFGSFKDFYDWITSPFGTFGSSEIDVPDYVDPHEVDMQGFFDSPGSTGKFTAAAVMFDVERHALEDINKEKLTKEIWDQHVNNKSNDKEYGKKISTWFGGDDVFNVLGGDMSKNDPALDSSDIEFGGGGGTNIGGGTVTDGTYDDPYAGDPRSPSTPSPSIQAELDAIERSGDSVGGEPGTSDDDAASSGQDAGGNPDVGGDDTDDDNSGSDTSSSDDGGADGADGGY